MSDTAQAIDWVVDNMPTQSAAALAQFTVRNPHFRGAHWDDCLDIIMDSDADLQWTEPLHEVDETFPADVLESAVTTTLAWAVEAFVEQPASAQIAIVRSTIADKEYQSAQSPD